jgi:hypothetical protein
VPEVVGDDGVHIDQRNRWVLLRDFLGRRTGFERLDDGVERDPGPATRTTPWASVWMGTRSSTFVAFMLRPWSNYTRALSRWPACTVGADLIDNKVDIGPGAARLPNRFSRTAPRLRLAGGLTGELTACEAVSAPPFHARRPSGRNTMRTCAHWKSLGGRSLCATYALRHGGVLSRPPAGLREESGRERPPLWTPRG